MTETGTLSHLPLFLDVRGRRCVVVGGGIMAEGKCAYLTRAGADVTVIAPRLEPELGALAQAGKVTWLRRSFQPTDLDNTVIAIYADEDAEALAQVRHAATARNVLFNAVDRQSGNDFITPSVLDRSPVVVAVSTGGAAPALARNIRQRLERALPKSIGRLARVAGLFRCQAAKRLTDAPQRRAFWDRVLGAEYETAAGQMDDAALAKSFGEEMARAGRSLPTGARTGSVTLVGAGPGSADYLTLAGLRALETADVILYDALVTREVLDHARRDAKMIPVGKRGGAPSTKQDFINAQLTSHAKRGLKVVRLKGGDPFTFGRGAEEMAYVKAQGISCRVIPGITAAMAASAETGRPLTHRGVGRRLVLATARTRSDAETDALDWTSCTAEDSSAAIYMASHRLNATTRAMIQAGRPGATPCLVVENAGRAERRTIEGSLETIAAKVGTTGLNGPSVLLVGEALNAATHASLNERENLYDGSIHIAAASVR